MPLKASHLRQVSHGSPESGDEAEIFEPGGSTMHGQPSPMDGGSLPLALVCTLGIHDEAFSKDHVLVNPSIFVERRVPLGTCLQIISLEVDSPRLNYKRYDSDEHGFADGRRLSAKVTDRSEGEVSYVFNLPITNSEIITRHPKLEVSVSQKVASALGFKNRSQVSMSQVEESVHLASHVEIAFRDAYLTRADMWRLAVSELANKSMYKGQRLVFMGTIKAQIKTIYIKGEKVQSAFFGPSTKTVFRSESARYVLFIQMSKEMWHFDTDGTGDLMFHKVVNGFLPELFGRWEELGVRHLVSVILFTRMEYERSSIPELELPTGEDAGPHMRNAPGKKPYKDFYRVLVSDTASSQSAAILIQLKKEFKIFLRDVSIRPSTPADRTTMDDDGRFTVRGVATEVIEGRPTAASQGNVLEAINLASFHFSADYVDRDLVRTGLSVVVVTPGTGVFEVDYNLLCLTTETLIGNGIGIDLVCLSRMPLHSVPLFKYKTQNADQVLVSPQRMTTASGLSNSVMDDPPLTPTPRVMHPGLTANPTPDPEKVSSNDEWSFGIPHWVDVSFWTPASNDKIKDKDQLSTRQLANANQKPFVPRVSMYEVQMMGIMENDMSNISIPYLTPPPSDVQPSARLVPTFANILPQPSMSSLSSNASRKATLRQNNLNMPQLPMAGPASPNRPSRLEVLSKWMDDYDDAVFRHPNDPLRKRAMSPTAPGGPGESHYEEHGPRSGLSRSSSMASSEVGGNHDMHGSIKTTSGHQSSSSGKNRATALSSPSPAGARPANLTRQISYGLRGFGGLVPKATPIAQISSEHALSDSLLTRGLRLAQPKEAQSQLSSDPSDPKKLPSPAISGTASKGSSSDIDQASQPIAIRMTDRGPSALKSSFTHQDNGKHKEFERLSLRQEHDARSPQQAEDEPTGLSPRKAIAPWLTVLNPSNPPRSLTDPTHRLGRWQHVFPRPLRASNIKWKSLCSPATVPLTTEDFPTKEKLATEYQENVYRITAAKQYDLSEDDKPHNWLIRELISARFSHGFQIIVGSRPAQTLGISQTENPNIYSDDAIGERDIHIFMARGNLIHQLFVMDTHTVEVKQFSRRSIVVKPWGQQEDISVIYNPAVRETLSERYFTREIRITMLRDAYDWQRMDTFIANHEEQKLDSYPATLHFWRARYVLIPVEHPSSTNRLLKIANEDNDEEIRLEGIRQLTQLWQKNRYFLPDEKRFPAPVRKRKDTNPLDIIYQTRKPSAIVAAELNETLLLDNEVGDGKLAQLLPDSHLFERGNLNLTSLAQAMQGERGVKMLDRRWHFRLHYNCFIGMEFATWLLNNFRDVDSREESVELGNELMNGGLFQHVEGRHNFRDGNFFYQITNEYRTPQPDTRSSWFGRMTDRSVPSTPSWDSRRESSGVQSRSSSNGDAANDDGASTPTGKKRLGVTLSKKLIYDVDHRKRSYRNELIALHYDRISSADDCYHLHLDWMNVTPKLIEDAIVNWATSAERFGLRLVELPIIEASKINKDHPFQGHILVELAKQPPAKAPLTYFDATSLVPNGGTAFTYHIAILKKFSFVLDFEAAKDFPPSVDVSYSWGKPDYQYSQYISRDGSVLAQITDEGHFLLLVNRLYNNRSAAAREERRAQHTIIPEGDVAHRRSPGRGPGAPHLASPRGSPHASPMIRAAPDSMPAGPRRSTEATSPESIKDGLQAFCSDVKALEIFYDEVLHKAPSPGTPFLEHSVPDLGPLPTLNLRDVSPSLHQLHGRDKARARTRGNETT